MSNPFEGIFDNLDLPVAENEGLNVTPIYAGVKPSTEPVVRPATAQEAATTRALGISLRQQNNSCVLARTLYINNQLMDAPNILSIWPEYEATGDRKVVGKAGPPPSIEVLNAYLVSEAFRDRMAMLGVYLGVNSLNGKQISYLNMMGDTGSKMSPDTIRKKLKISPVEYQSWLAQPAFQEAFSKTGNRVISDVIPAAKARLARKMEDGDLAFIKFGFEVTGEYNPADRKSVDAQALIRVIFEVLEEEIKDPSILKRIGAKVQLRGSGGAVVRGELDD